MKPLSKEQLTDIPIIQLEDIYLRPIQYEDFEDVYDYGKDDEVTRLLTWDSFDSVDEAKMAITHVFLTRPDNDVPSAYAIVDLKTDKMIGTCDFFRVDWDQGVGEIGYVLHKDFWGKGYMTQATKALIDFGFNYLKLDTIEIGHAEDNIGSRRVIEKCGFRLVDKRMHKRLNRLTYYYEMTRTDYDKLYKSK
ncbi:MAG: GNAT family N-acetyltransferase [Candidatus Izemoplasma sp.]|nr:GNAT family N-acetyltransferase [Candidatus Izemoplasma sp.]